MKHYSKLTALLFFFIVILFSCKKDKLTINEMGIEEGQASKKNKVKVCHYSEDCDCFITINVSQNALQAHLNHGDLEYVEGQECGISDPVVGITHVPDLFTPNGDGIDDTWIVESVGLTNYTLVVYDTEWYDVNAEITTPNVGWDGVDFYNNPAPSGTYLYEIYSDQEYRTGTFTLVR